MSLANFAEFLAGPAAFILAACRLGFFRGFVQMALAVLEELVRMADLTLIGQTHTDTFLNVGGILIVVVIALLPIIGTARSRNGLGRMGVGNKSVPLSA